MPEADPQKRPRGRPRGSGTTPAQGGTVQALDRGMTLLSALARDGKGSLSDVAGRVAMPPSSAYRLLTTLQGHGIVAFDETAQEWMIGVEAFRIGRAFVHRVSVMEAAREPMRHLMRATGETANLAIADAGSVVFMSQVESLNPVRAFFRPGTRGPLHASGIGKALLAEMDVGGVAGIVARNGLEGFTPRTLTTPERLSADLALTRRRGWAYDDEERYSGMRCIAAPIFDTYGEAVAGVSVSGPTVRFPDIGVEDTATHVREAAAAITDLIGGTMPVREG